MYVYDTPNNIYGKNRILPEHAAVLKGGAVISSFNYIIIITICWTMQVSPTVDFISSFATFCPF